MIANTIQVDALAQLLIEEGLISEQKFLAKLKTVQADYRKRQSYDLKNLYPEVKQALIELSLMLTFNLESRTVDGYITFEIVLQCGSSTNRERRCQSADFLRY